MMYESASMHDPMLHNVLAAVPDAVVVLDRDGKVLAVNARAHEWLGLREGDVVDPTLELAMARFVSEEGSPLVPTEHPAVRTLRDGKPHRDVALQLVHHGRREPVRVHAQPLGDRHDGGPAGVIVVIQPTSFGDDDGSHESTLRRRIFEQLARGVVHEIRNPLNSLLINSEMLELTIERGGDLHKYAERIQRQTRKLAEIMNHLQELRKSVNRENLAVHPAHEALEQAVEQWRQTHPDAAMHAVRLEVPDEAGALAVRVDIESFALVFAHLLQNAVENSPEQEEVIVRLVMPQNGERFVRLQVADRGRGVDDGDLPFLFDPFYSTRKGAVGLGLTVVRQVVEDLGGEVDLANNSDAGCTVEIRLPHLRARGEHAA